MERGPKAFHAAASRQQQTLSFLSPAAREEKKSCVAGPLAGRQRPLLLHFIQPNSRICFHSVQSAITGIISINFSSLINWKVEFVEWRGIKLKDCGLWAQLLSAEPFHSKEIKFLFHFSFLGFALSFKEKTSPRHLSLIEEIKVCWKRKKRVVLLERLGPKPITN